MTLDAFLDTLPEFAKDIKLNISSVLSEMGSPGLTSAQIAGVALASAYTAKDSQVIGLMQTYASAHLTDTEITAVKGAAVLMAMNNVYYRFTHMVSDESYQTMPAKLRMNFLRNHGIATVNMELYSLAVSAINACQLCIDAHVAEVIKHGISKEGIQSTIRIAACVNALAQASVLQ